MGSYNLIEVEVENLVNGYLSTTLLLSKIKELQGLKQEDYKKTIYLKPRETKSVFWIVKVDETLDTGYTYSFPLEVRTIRNVSDEAMFMAAEDGSMFSYSELKNIVDAKGKREKKYSKELKVNCASNQEIYYLYDEPKITCSIKNAGNVNLNELKICLDKDCKYDGLAINQEKAYEFRIPNPKTGLNKLVFGVESDDVTKSMILDLEVLDEPKIMIDEVEFPSEIEYEQDYQLRFMLIKESKSDPQDVVILVNAAGLAQEIKQARLNNDEKYVINMNSKDLLDDENIFNISVRYKDLNDRKYYEEETFNVKLKNMTLWQKVKRLVMNLDVKLRDLFNIS